MASHENTNAAYNAVAVALGDAGGHLNEIDSLNAICVALGGAGGHLAAISALNECDTIGGGAGGHAAVINALNSILTVNGGTAGQLNELDAANEWVDFPGGSFTPSNAVFWANMFQEGSGQTVVNHGSGVDFWRGATGAPEADDPAWNSPIGLSFDGADLCIAQSGQIAMTGDFLIIVPHTAPSIVSNQAFVGSSGGTNVIEYRSFGEAFRVDSVVVWTHGQTYVADDVVLFAARRVGTDLYMYTQHAGWSGALAYNSNTWNFSYIGTRDGTTRFHDRLIYDVALLDGTFSEAEADAQIAGIRANCEDFGVVF